MWGLQSLAITNAIVRAHTRTMVFSFPSMEIRTERKELCFLPVSMASNWTVLSERAALVVLDFDRHGLSLVHS
jgi:hypothetical protein